MQINNKLESIKLIRDLKINSFSEELFCKGDDEKVISFLDENLAIFYAIRSKDEVCSKKKQVKSFARRCFTGN